MQTGQTGFARATCLDANGNQIGPPLPSGATSKWSSSDNTIATVSVDPNNPQAATVTAVAPGTATITFTVTNANGTVVSGTATETVVAPPPPVVASVTVSVP